MADDATLAPRDRKQPESVRESVRIDPWLRWATGVLGLGGLGTGGIAVFVTKLEAGPVALLGGGLLLLLIAIAGRLPRRLKFGDNEAEFYEERYDRAISFATDLAAKIDPDTQPEAVETLQEFRRTEPGAGSRIFDALGYEPMVQAMLDQIVRRRGDRFIRPAELLPTARLERTPAQQAVLFDGLLVRADDKRHALVEIKASTGDIDRSWIQVLHDRFVRGAQQYSAEMLMFITKEPLSRAAGMRMQDFTDKVWVIVSGPHDMANLEAAVEQVIGKLPFEQ
jgi:hypothetical protein